MLRKLNNPALHFMSASRISPLLVTEVRYNSPFEMTVSFPTLDPKNIAEALKEAVDTVIQAKQRLKQAELETRIKAEQQGLTPVIGLRV